MPASASAATSCGRVSGLSLMHARAEVSRHSAIPPSVDRPGNELFSQCTSSPARQAWPSAQRGGGWRGKGVGAGGGCVGRRRADLVHPARVLVAENVGERRAHRRVPLALDDVQVSAADAGAADLHDDVERSADLGLRYVVDHRLSMKFVQPDGLHGSSTCFLVTFVKSPRPQSRTVSPCPWVLLYLCRSMPRQIPEFASMLTRVTLALRRCSGSASAWTGAPVPGSMSSRASSPAGRPRSARRSRNRSSAREGGSSPRVSASNAAWSCPAASSGLHT